jgi:hypothetical protein
VHFTQGDGHLPVLSDYCTGKLESLDLMFSSPKYRRNRKSQHASADLYCPPLSHLVRVYGH